MHSYPGKNKAAPLKGGLLALLLFSGPGVAEEGPDRISADQLRSMENASSLEAVALYPEFLALPNDAIYP